MELIGRVTKYLLENCLASLTTTKDPWISISAVCNALGLGLSQSIFNANTFYVRE